MSQINSSKKNWYSGIKEIETYIFENYLKIFVSLWVPAFTAALSIIFFTFIPQTIEVYRIFASNFTNKVGYLSIFCSFTSIFFLSVMIWYSGRNLLLEKDSRNLSYNDSNFIATTKRWMPRLLGCMPLVALFFGLLQANQSISDKVIELHSQVGKLHSQIGELKQLQNQTVELSNQLVISAVLFFVYWIFVLCRKQQKIRLLSDPYIFGPRFILILNSLSVLVLAIFTFPLVSDNSWMRIFVIAFLLFLQYLISWFLSAEKSSEKINPIRQLWLSRLTLDYARRNQRSTIFVLLALSAFILILVACLPYFVFNPLASTIGPVSIIALFLTVCVFWGSLLFDYGNTTGIPFIAILLIFAISFGGLNWNDNHKLRELPSSNQTAPDNFKDLKKSIDDWMKSPRKEQIEKFNKAGKTYPIYIASAQGGGIFAAYQAALTLSRLQDRFPDFASHVFAVSGVSGGSLGASVYSSLVADHHLLNAGKVAGKHDSLLGPLETKSHEVLDHDFLSPLLSAGLFPDFIQRFMPVIPIRPFSTLGESVDRARGIEYAFEEAWDHARDKWDQDQKISYDPRKDNPLRNSYYKQWNPIEAAPALVLNTTVVETGERLVLSPFKIDLPDLKDIRTVACNENIDFPLSTAANLSARFTFVTPVGWFMRCEQHNDKNGQSQKARLADGGYFENSGISTAFEIGERLEETLREEIKSGKIKVIYLAITDKSSSEIPKAGGFSEVMSPVSTLFNSREARGRSAVSQIEYLVDVANADPNLTKKSESRRTNFQIKYADHHFRQFYLHDLNINPETTVQSFSLPLGWFLSKHSQDQIQAQIGPFYNKPEIACQDDLKNSRNNHCVFRSIKEELSLSLDFGQDRGSKGMKAIEERIMTVPS